MVRMKKLTVLDGAWAPVGRSGAVRLAEGRYSSGYVARAALAGICLAQAEAPPKP